MFIKLLPSPCLSVPLAVPPYPLLAETTALPWEGLVFTSCCRRLAWCPGTVVPFGGALGTGCVPGPRTGRCCLPKQPGGKHISGICGWRQLSHCTPQHQWWPQLLERSPARLSPWENVSLVLAGGQVGLPAGYAGLAPVSCLVNKVLFGINLADLSFWGFSCHVCWVHGR